MYLQVQDIKYVYQGNAKGQGAVTAIEGMNFSVERGEFVSILTFWLWKVYPAALN
mgnify:CR=1 FL=1